MKDIQKDYDTLGYYNNNAELYCEQTLACDMQESYNRFLQHLPKGVYILDFGCGPGRDSKYFMEHGYQVKAIDGSSEMCKIASRYLNQEVDCMRFEELNDINTYDGIWACCSIMHLEKEKLLGTLAKMINALKSSGIIYASFKVGIGYKIENDKYYNLLTKDKMIEALHNINKNVELIDYFENLSTKKSKSSHGVVWGNYIIKKHDS